MMYSDFMSCEVCGIQVPASGVGKTCSDPECVELWKQLEKKQNEAREAHRELRREAFRQRLAREGATE